MTRLRQAMLDELERRNYSQTTRRAYLLAVADFARYFHRPPDQLGLEHVRDYQVYLFRVRKLKPNSVAVRVAALRFLFVHVLHRPWTVADMPYPKRPDTLPTVLSQENETALRRPRTRPRISRQLYAPDRHLESPPGRAGGRQRQFPLARLSAQEQEARNDA